MSTSTTTTPARPTRTDLPRPLPLPRSALRRALPALGLFAAARLTGILLLSAAAWRLDRNPLAILGTSWDSRWYTGIAAHGYGRSLAFEDGVIQSDLAFFPLYPALIRLASAVLPTGPTGAALLVSWVAAAAAAVAVYLIGERLHGRRAATLLVLLWGLLPHSVVLTMAYTEPVLTALSAWSLYAVLGRHWLWAGALASLAGLSRPNGIAVAAAVVVAAAYEIWRGDRQGRAAPAVWLAAALAPAGWGGYVLGVGVLRGDPLGGYFAVQAGWTSRFDLGLGSLRFVKHLLRDPDQLSFAMVLVIVAVALLLFALFVLDRPPLPLLVYTAVLLLITVGGSGFFESKARFLLPAFPLLLPPAAAMAKTRPGAAVLVTVALAGLSFSYGTYLLTIAPTPL
ncbi:glycosyltransferase family 39 protein [Streptomyces sp. A3M-1-3]|uniref:glycosyltransferase family 39 protein n=1 Tax=Streptomyces sp. A3M-1-3 TaxID=2962044 RepID=UPI0020B7EC06|nr:glycosyltransferase family 39 protein [Streptomyces sp. A3M-1-3]MCP3822532.1 glycosyltransferase family 39 protein [Streptomyces sp. A3M-1-3]